MVPSSQAPEPDRSVLVAPSFVDVNFDGYSDIVFQQYLDGSDNFTYDAWLTTFLPDQNPAFRFELFEGYSEILNPELKPEERSIISNSKVEIYSD